MTDVNRLPMSYSLSLLSVKTSRYNVRACSLIFIMFLFCNRVYLNLCRGIEFSSVIVTHWQFADMVMTELQAFQHPVQVRTENSRLMVLSEPPTYENMLDKIKLPVICIWTLPWLPQTVVNASGNIQDEIRPFTIIPVFSSTHCFGRSPMSFMLCENGIIWLFIYLFTMEWFVRSMC